MASSQMSSYKAMSLRSFSSFWNAPSTNIFNSGRSFAPNFLAFLNMTYYSTSASNDLYPSSKRRSRGPVMAAKGCGIESCTQGIRANKIRVTIDGKLCQFSLILMRQLGL